MKLKQTPIKHCAILALAAIAALIELSPKAHALSLAYETPGPWGPAGTPFVSGPLEFVFTGVGAGTIYQPFGPTGTVVGTGAGVMDALAGQMNPIKAIGSEDQFGVVFVFQIKDANTNAVIWSPAGKNKELVGTFYGGTDIWGRQDALGLNPTQTTAQTGLRVNLYEQSTEMPLPDLAAITPANRNTGVMVEGTTPNAADFPLWTEDQNGVAIPNLTLALSFKGVTGFLDPSAGATVGLNQLVEVQSTFVNSLGSQGNVQGFLAVNPLLGSGSLIDNNQFAAIFNANTADARFTFTQQTLSTANPWDVSVNGPLQTLITSVPEPGSALAGIACALSVVSSRRRKQKSV